MFQSDDVIMSTTDRRLCEILQQKVLSYTKTVSVEVVFLIAVFRFPGKKS